MNAYQEEVLKAVDNLAAEIARVQQLVEQAFPVNESKPMVDDNVVTYEGQPYKLVNRLAKTGDVVMFTDKHETYSTVLTVGKSYLVVVDKHGDAKFLSDEGIYLLAVYSEIFNRTPETVKVYEPTTWEAVQEKATQDVQHHTVDCCHDAPTPNERRAELIERAKQFHAEQRMQHNIHIGIYKNERKVEARCVQQDSSYNIGTAVIEEDAVFNLDIAKAIAVGRALDIDVSEFANAVQPNKPVVGMHIRTKRWYHTDEITDVTEDQIDVISIENGDEAFYDIDSWKRGALLIIDDTNAQY